MSDEARLMWNLTLFLMGCDSETLARVAHLLGCELVARGLRGEGLAFELSRTLARQPGASRTPAMSVLAEDARKAWG